MTTGTAEERYTLECFPGVYLLASRCLATLWTVRSRENHGYIDNGGSGSVG
jgi:hypothetical protein